MLANKVGFVDELFIPSQQCERIAINMTVFEWFDLSGLGSGVGNEVDDSVRVAEFVVVPWDQLDEIVVQLDAGVGIEDRAAGVSVEV